MEMCVMVRKGKGVRHFQTEYPLTDGGGLIISIIRACPLLSLLAQHTLLLFAQPYKPKYAAAGAAAGTIKRSVREEKTSSFRRDQKQRRLRPTQHIAKEIIKLKKRRLRENIDVLPVSGRNR